MKKTIFTLAAVAVAFVMNAQTTPKSSKKETKKETRKEVKSDTTRIQTEQHQHSADSANYSTPRQTPKQD